MVDIFSKILAKEIPAEVVYEDEHTLAFLDIQPVNEGHTLIIPKQKSEQFDQVDQEQLKHLMNTVQIVAKAIKKAYNTDYNVLVNSGKDAGQVVFYTHVHIIPRKENDGVNLSGGSNKEPSVPLSEVREKIIANISR